MKRAGLVIVGGGQAGFQLAVSARSAGFAEPVTIVTDELSLPYQRPPLSKGYLLGKIGSDQLLLQKADFLRAKEVGVLTGRRIVEIDRRGSIVKFADGVRLPYEHLALANGAAPRSLHVPGSKHRGIFALKTVSDADRLREALADAERIVVVGGGFIGLEFAAVARQLGKRVLVVETTTRVMARAVPAFVSQFFEDLHRTQGVRFALGRSVVRFLGDAGRVSGVELDSSAVEPADLVLVGIGVAPNDQLAAACELATSNGILVDHQLRTSDPHIFAIGDCASYPSGNGRLRLESVQNAIDHGKHAAQALVGAQRSYDALPWFWSDQFDVKLQIAGLTGGADSHVVRGDPTTGKFSVFSFRDGRLVGVDSINHPLDHAAARRLLSAECALTPVEAGDLSFDLRRTGRGPAA